MNFRRGFLLRAATLLVIAGCICDSSACTKTARADGGTLRLSQAVGERQIAVFTDPTPLRVGMADVSVWLQSNATHEATESAEITVAARPLGEDRSNGDSFADEATYAATRAQATAPIMRAAKIPLRSAGTWELEVTVREKTASATCPEGFTSKFLVDVAPPLPRWRELATWIFWPLAPIGLFALHLLFVRTRPA